MQLMTAVVFVVAGAALGAHVRVTPVESRVGATQTYTARVPTEGKVATTSVQVDIPDGVTVVSAAVSPGMRYDFTRDGDRVVAIVWTVDIQPGTAAELSFVVQNPAAGNDITWKFHQRYADGTSSEWVGPSGSRGPAPVTRLLP
jgi:uncharacterized protein YcnI